MRRYSADKRLRKLFYELGQFMKVSEITKIKNLTGGAGA